MLAHPDDESFGMGGTLALYARRGVETHLVCATNGDVGTVAPEKMQGYRSVSELRLAELRCAAEALGLTGLHLLGYRDSGMPGSPDNQHSEALAAAPVEEVARRVATHIRQIRPQVVITFDPIGGYLHPDHVAIHRATVRAFDLAADPATAMDGLPPYRPAKLYYHTWPRGWLRLIVHLLPLLGRDPRRWGRNRDIDLVELTRHNFPIHAHIDIRPVLEVKQRAIQCHASQLDDEPGAPRLVAWFFRRGRRQETFMRAYPPAPPGLKEQDLYEALEEAAATPAQGLSKV